MPPIGLLFQATIEWRLKPRLGLETLYFWGKREHWWWDTNMYGSAYYLIQQIIWNDMQQRANYVKFIRVSEVWSTFFFGQQELYPIPLSKYQSCESMYHLNMYRKIIRELQLGFDLFTLFST